LSFLCVSVATAATPVPLDAVVAAPASHRIIFENDRVRVLSVTIPPGKTEPVHTHKWPSVMRVDVPQPITYLTYAAKDGKLVETGRKLQPMRAPAEAELKRPGFSGGSYL
jgi:hypothetical protein